MLMTERSLYMRRLALSILFVWSATLSFAGGFEFTGGGSSGTVVGKRFDIGAAAKAFLQEAFVVVPGMDLNGPMIGTAGRISLDQLPIGMTASFTSRVQMGGETVELEYVLQNAGDQTFSGLRFFYYLDLEIGEATNTFFNEYADVMGRPGQGSSDSDADMYSVDEPGFGKWTGRDRLSDAVLWNQLDNLNHVPQTTSNDVAMCLGFDLGVLRPGDRCVVRVLVSSEGVSTGSLVMVHKDTGSAVATCVTVSGAAERSAARCRLNVAMLGAGMVSATNGWYPRGAAIAIQATPAVGSRFLKWAGDVSSEHSQDSVVLLLMDQDRCMTAEFGHLGSSDLRVGVMSDRQVVRPGDRFPFHVQLANAGPDVAGLGRVAVSGGVGMKWLTAKPSTGYADVAGRLWMVDSLVVGGVESLKATAVAASPLDILVGDMVPLEHGAMAFCAFADGRLAIGMPEAEVDGIVCGKLRLRGIGGATLDVPAPTLTAGAHFGYAVAPMGGGITAASIFPDGLAMAGRVNLFDSHGQFIREITAPADCESQRFGFTLAGIEQDMICVGAPASPSGTVAGVVYLVDSNGTTTGVSDPFPQTGNRFGETVALDGQRVVVGACNQTVADSAMEGSVYVYNHAMSLQRQLGSPLPQTGDEFGYSLCLLSDGVAIGAPGADYADSKDCGVVYIYGFDGNLMATVPNPAPQVGARFGSSLVAVGNGFFAVGAGDANVGQTGSCVQVFSSDGCWVASLPSLSSAVNSTRMASAGERRLWLEQSLSGARSLKDFVFTAKGLAFVDSIASARFVNEASVDGNLSNNVASVRIVIDAEAPKFEGAPSAVLDANDEGVALFDGPLPTVTDNYDSAPVWDSKPRLPCMFQGVGTNTILYWAVDSAGNTGTFSQIIQVVDHLPPRLQAPVDLELPLGSDGICRFEGALPVAVDNTDPNPVVTSEPLLPVVFTATGSYSIVYTASDVIGNVMRVVQTIRVFSSTPTNSLYAEPTLVLENASAEYSDALSLRASLQVGGVACSGATLHFMVGGENAGEAVTDEGGYAELTCRPELIPGSFDILAVFEQNDSRQLLGARSEAQATVGPEKASLAYVGDVLLSPGRSCSSHSHDSHQNFPTSGSCQNRGRCGGGHPSSDGDFKVATLVTQEDDDSPGNLERAAVVFGFALHLADDTVTNVYGATAWCDSTGLASLDLDIGPGLYWLSVGTATNSYFRAGSISETLVSLGDDEGKITGGGVVAVTDPKFGTIGRANFGFCVQTDRNGAKGNLEYQCKDARIDLKGSTIDWLVVNGASAQFQGTGSLKRRSGVFTFQMFCIEGNRQGCGRYGTADRVTIRIWEGRDTKQRPIYEVIDQTIKSGTINIH